MSLNLNVKCKLELVNKIASISQNIVVERGNHPNIESLQGLFEIDRMLPQSGAIKRDLDQYIDEYPLYGFIYESLTSELREKYKYNENALPIKLTDLETFKDPMSYSATLIEKFNSLPWEYVLSIKMGQDFVNKFANTFQEYHISNDIKLIRPDDEFLEKFPLKSKSRKAMSELLTDFIEFPGLGFPEFDRNMIYLQIYTKGFIPKNSTTRPLDDALFLLKVFCGLAFALELFRPGLRFLRPLPFSKPSSATFVIHRKEETSWVYERFYDLEENVSGVFTNLQIIGNPVEVQDMHMLKLQMINKVFSNREDAINIILGGQWLFDSYCGDNDLLSFVQSIVVLEILLGEKAKSDILGLSELLSNRCAYLISKSQKERTRILNDFRKLYKVRSQIVHRGKNRLDSNEKYELDRLQWMCHRVIQEEIKLLVNVSEYEWRWANLTERNPTHTNK